MSSAAHYGALSRRSFVQIFRTPAALVPSLSFPLLFLALNTSIMARATSLTGFPPVDSFMQFMITATIVQGTLFGATAAGTEMARDIEEGFFDRLLVTPVSRWAILVGRIAGAAGLAFCQAWLFMLLATPFGLEVEGGLLGMFGLALIATVAAAGAGAFTAAIGLKSGSAEVVQGSFPAIFVFLFISSAFFPRDLMNGWFQSAASLNPLSHMIESMRHLVIFGWSANEFLIALGIATGIFVAGALTSARALRGRLLENV